jgi:DNA-binding Lrp family transcriptional regulator
MGWPKPLSPTRIPSDTPVEIARERLVIYLFRCKSPCRCKARVAREVRAKTCQNAGVLLDCAMSPKKARWRRKMVPFFIQIKCQLGKAYQVANQLADAEIASEIYSTAGDFDLLAKFYVDRNVDIGHFVNEKVQTIPGIQDTRTIITFKAF